MIYSVYSTRVLAQALHSALFFSEGKMKFSNTVKIFSIQISSVHTWSVSSIDSYYSVQNFFSSAKARNAVDYIWLSKAYEYSAHNIKCLKKVVGSTVLKLNLHTSEISVQILQCTLSRSLGEKGKVSPPGSYQCILRAVKITKWTYFSTWTFYLGL